MIDSHGFDAGWYLSQNADVKAARIDPYQHYLEYGWREGRNPNALFDTKFYLANNADVRGANIDPLAHYFDWGWREGRDPSAQFDTSRYLDANSDVKAASINPLAHWFEYGQAEGRVTFPIAPPVVALPPVYGFDSAFYLAQNPDVRAAGVDPLLHYRTDGIREGRSPNALFNAAAYLAANPDVRAAGVDPYQHYLVDGWREGRNPSLYFDISDYQDRFHISTDPLRDYLDYRRYTGLPSSAATTPLPAINYAPNGYNFVGVFAAASLVQSTDGLHVFAASSPMDGRLFVNYDTVDLSLSFGPISFSGSARLPSGLTFGSGNDALTGVYDIGSRQILVNTGAGAFDAHVQVDQSGGGTITFQTQGPAVVYQAGNAQISFLGSGNFNDVVHGGSGNDYFTGGGGTDAFDGGTGTDTVDFGRAVPAGVDVDLVAGTAVDRGGSFHETLVSIETVYGSSVADRIAGGDGRDNLNGREGNDVLVGRDGVDQLSGGDGNDILIGGRGADMLTGGSGNDLLIDEAVANWEVDSNPPVYNLSEARGGDGHDLLVWRLASAPGDLARPSYLYGDAGADTFILDASHGSWGSIALFFHPEEKDQIDLSALRDLDGSRLTFSDIVAAASNPFTTSTVIDLSRFEDDHGTALSGRLVMNGVFDKASLAADQFVLSGGVDWQSMVPNHLDIA